jgi:hypothetical protein
MVGVSAAGRRSNFARQELEGEPIRLGTQKKQNFLGRSVQKIGYLKEQGFWTIVRHHKSKGIQKSTT